MTKDTSKDYVEKIDYETLFPLRAALFLPKALKNSNKNLLATIESVMPILDIAIIDAHKRYLNKWTKKRYWMKIKAFQIFECEDQKTAAWSALKALEWATIENLYASFGPSCDYALATINRILSFYEVPMFSNAGFTEFFHDKNLSYLTRVGIVMEKIENLIGDLSQMYNWKKLQLHYQKNFWHTELLENSFCKIIMNDIYGRYSGKMNVQYSILTKSNYREYLRVNVGVEYGRDYLSR
uniref:ANF_receptor domain-containing protein n=1 Tax=Strongyloides venezuelensis TaxID=75913 RepID=A0A0K0F8E8_STRVS